MIIMYDDSTVFSKYKIINTIGHNNRMVVSVWFSLVWWVHTLGS